MWAFVCGAVSVGVALGAEWPLLIVGALVAGPMVCATSQAVNDWFDRHVDAINEPNRPIPSGRLPGRTGLWIGVAWTALSLAGGLLLGPVGFAATALALVLAWMYSAPPFRLKRNGWVGNLVVGLSYEGLAWVTGAAVALGGAFPGWRTLVLALLYSLGAHGIMTLNDYKSRHGDLKVGIRSLPALLGPERASWAACGAMLSVQVVVVALLLWWGSTVAAMGVLALMVAQLWIMRPFLAKPDADTALRVSAIGVPFYVLGMMLSAIALRGIGA
jgi:chlorophyll synthase